VIETVAQDTHQGVAPGAATAAGRTRGAARLGWLDALRGIAALAVVYRHTGSTLLSPVYNATSGVIDAGTFGVLLFFLVSGYIVPASLERRGDLRAFWIGRYFRIYPLFITVVGAGLLLVPASLGAVSAGWFSNPVATFAGNSVLLTELLGDANGLKVSWTLSYEMVFYFLVTALFALGWHRRSAPIAVGLGALAVVAGTTMPVRLLSSGATSMHYVVAGTVLVVLIAMSCIMSGGALPVKLGALLLGALGLLLVTLNSGLAGFYSMMILATMFSGTVIYRAEHGQIKRWPAVLCCALVLAAGLTSGLLYDARFYTTTWTDAAGYCGAMAGAWGVFGIGLLLRNRRFPRFLSWLGTVSYAVYLVHWPVFVCSEWTWHHLGLTAHGGWQELGHGAVYLPLVLASAYAGHRLVELPGQNIGRRVTTWAGRRSAAAAAAAAAGQARAAA